MKVHQQALLAGFAQSSVNPRFAQVNTMGEQLRAHPAWQGRVTVKALNGAATQAQIESVKPEDAAQVDDWYNPQPEGKPSYASNPKWREWWTAMIQKPSRDHQVLKLTLPGNQILGVISLQHGLLDSTDGQPKTYLHGIRIKPSCNAMMTPSPEYKGVGAALVTQGVIESLKLGLKGFLLNATLGAEEFYRKLNFNERASLDGKRRCFYLGDEPERSDFLAKRLSIHT